MNQARAIQQLAAQLQARTKSIANDLQAGETVLDAGEVNELSMNTPTDLGAGEALLFVTDRRLIFHRSGRSLSLGYGHIRSFNVKRAPRGVPQRSSFRELTVNLTDGGTHTFIGGRMFLAAVSDALRQRT